LVLKFASVVEVFVPYDTGEPRPMDQRDNPFGQNMILLEPGVDCYDLARALAALGTRAVAVNCWWPAPPLYEGEDVCKLEARRP
jgi:hypothetical protein